MAEGTSSMLLTTRLWNKAGRVYGGHGSGLWATAFVGVNGKGLGLSSERASLSSILKDEE